jgi:hypothetical protein
MTVLRPEAHAITRGHCVSPRAAAMLVGTTTPTAPHKDPTRTPSKHWPL